MACPKPSLTSLFETFGHRPHFYVGFSGGLDSQVLLSLLLAVRNVHPFQLTAVHINHNVSSNAQDWMQHCEDFCKLHQVDFKSFVLADLDPHNFEENARIQRYEIFSALLNDGDILLTGHHQDDQAETVLLQLFRGAGLSGLSGMPKMKALGKGLLVRPLLDFSRASLLQYAQENNLKWIEDESNQSSLYARNYLRNDILPLIKRRWPGVISAINRTAENCQESQVLLAEMVDLTAVAGSVPNTLSVNKLVNLSEVQQRNLLRAWIQKQGYRVPNKVKLMQLQNDFLTCSADKMPRAFWDEVELRRYRDDLYLFKQLKQVGDSATVWDLKTPLQLNGGVLHCEEGSGAFSLKKSVANVYVRFRQGGEVCRLPGRKISHSLKKLFQQWGVPVWLRDRIPLLYVGEELVLIPDYFVAEKFAADGEEGSQILFLPHL